MTMSKWFHSVVVGTVTRRRERAVGVCVVVGCRRRSLTAR